MVVMDIEHGTNGAGGAREVTRSEIPLNPEHDQNTTVTGVDGAPYASKVLRGEISETNSNVEANANQVADMCSETNLYRSWMMVQPRRRSSSNLSRKVTEGVCSKGQPSDSRFRVLDSKCPDNDRDDVTIAEAKGGTENGDNVGNPSNPTDKEHRPSSLNGLKNVERNVTRSATYFTSNWDKKNKANKQHLESVEVVPIMDGLVPKVVNHVPRVNSKSHVAVRIVEKVYDGANMKIIRDLGGLGVVEWVKSTHARIDAIGRQANREPIDASTITDTSEIALQSSNDEENWDEDQLANMSNAFVGLVEGVGNTQ
ncbi:hypothetical protein V6N13_142181 [Hibiscus sabdariffa]